MQCSEERPGTREQLHLDIFAVPLQDEVARYPHADILPTIRPELPKDFVRLGRCIALNGFITRRGTGPLREHSRRLVVRGASFYGRRA